MPSLAVVAVVERDNRAMSDIRVIFVGDSFVAGVGDPEGVGWVGRLVAGAFAAGIPITAYNLGVRRERSADVLVRWQAEGMPRLTGDADCRIVFSFGANDATYENGSPRLLPDKSKENLSRALVDARRHDLSVFIVGPPPVNDHAQQERISTLSAGFREVAERHAAPYVGLVDSLRASPRWTHELERGDGAHPASEGYSLMADLIMPTWLAWLKGPSAAAHSETHA